MNKGEQYLELIRQQLKEVLLRPDFIGKIEVEINIKERAISNMNLAAKASIKL